jgi:hypothetical protein
MQEPGIARLLEANPAQEETMAAAARRTGERLAGAVAGGGRSGPARERRAGRWVTSAAARGPTARGQDLSQLTKDELLELAREAGIRGASRMKEELIGALRRAS